MICAARLAGSQWDYPVGSCVPAQVTVRPSMCQAACGPLFTALRQLTASVGVEGAPDLS
jgi:hypothetical protein